MYTISELYVYPIKSLAGVALDRAQLSDTGFVYDRQWMLVDTAGDFLTQREFPIMALFEVNFTQDGIRVRYRDSEIAISHTPTATPTMVCHIWEDTVEAVKESSAVSDWFSKHLGHKVHLVRMAPGAVRYVKRHAPAKLDFPDSSPYLILGEAAMKQLNQKLQSPVPINRFRPNIVFQGGTAHDEDTWQHITIGKSRFETTKACARCTLTTVDQDTGTKGTEPLETLATYRLIDKKILFGQYFKSAEPGNSWVAVGDSIHVLQRKNNL